MKICISEASVKDFNAFFKAKALELHAQKKFKNADELFKALYNEALNLSGDPTSVDNHDLVIQHLAMAPMGLNNAIPELQAEIAESLSNSIEAFNNPAKLQNLIENLQDAISTPIDIVEDEIDGPITPEDNVDEGRYSEGAIHVNLDTTIGSETLNFDNAVDQDKTTAFESKRTILKAVNQGSTEYKLKAMTYDKMLAQFDSSEVDLSTTVEPQQKNQKNTVVMIVVDQSGNPVRFTKDGSIAETGVIPVYSTESPTKIGESAYDYFIRGNFNPSDKFHKKFQALEENTRRNMKKRGLEYNPQDVLELVLGEEVTANGKRKWVGGWVPENKKLFDTIRKSDSYLLDINPETSTFGYVEITNNKTQLSDIKGIENYTFYAEKSKTDTEYRVTGSELHEGYAPLIPNDLTTDQEAIETIVQLLTNKNLKINGVKPTPAQIRELVSNYIGVTPNSDLISLDDKGKLKVYNKVADENRLREFLTTFQPYEQVADNSQNRVITTDLNNTDNTSAMLYQDPNGKLYKIYKPKFSFNKLSAEGNFNKVSVDENGNISTEQIPVKTHIIKNSSTKAFVNPQGLLKVYHPKLGYMDTMHEYDDEYGLNKTKEQKEAETKYQAKRLEAINERAESWFSNSPLSDVLELKDERANVDDTTENRQIVARWTGNAITLFAGAESRDLYHEAWHAYTQGLLTVEEKKKLYSAVRRIKEMKNKTDLQVEEWLADEFQKYAEGKSKVKKASVIGRFFEAILNGLKQLFGNYSKTDLRNNSVFQEIMETHFKNLYTHNIDVSKYSPSNFMFKSLNKNLEFPNAIDTKNRLSADETAKIMSVMDILMVDHLDKTITDSLKNGFQSVKDFQQGYKYVLEELKDFRFEEQEILNGFTKEDIGTPEFNLHMSRVEMLNAVIENYGDVENLENNLTNGATANSTIGFHLKNSKVNNYNVIKNLVEQDDFYENEDTSSGKIFERTGNDQSLYDMANEHIVYMLSTISKFETKRRRITAADIRRRKNHPNPKMRLTNNDLGKVEFYEEAVPSEFGLTELERPVVVMAKLGKLLNSSNNGDQMYNKMLESEDPTIKAVLKKLGSYESGSLTQQLLWSKFIQTFSKSNNKLQQFIVEAKIEGDQIKIESKYGTTIGGTSAVSRSWDAAFSTMDSEYVISTPEGMDINVDGILEDFLEDKGNGKWQLKNEDAHVEFFRAMGMNFTDKGSIETELSQNPDIVNAFANRLKNHSEVNQDLIGKNLDPNRIGSLKQLVGAHESISPEGNVSRQPGLHAYYNRLKQVEYDLSDKYNSFMATNAEGESQSELSLNNTASIITNDINGIAEGTHVDDVIRNNPHLSFLNPQDPMMRASNFYKTLFDENGNRTKAQINFENFSGSSLLQDESAIGLSNMNLDRSSKFMTDVYLSWLNKSEVTRMADKTTSMHIGVQKKQAFNPTNVQNISEKDTTMFNELKDYLAAEIVRMNMLNQTDVPFDQGYIERGGEFFIFDDILNDTIKKDLKKIKSTDFNEVSNLISKSEYLDSIISEINDYFVKKTNAALEAHQNDLFVSDTIMQQMQEMMSEEELENFNEETAKEIMIAMYARNKFLHNLDFTTFYLGDPALYKVTKEDFHKRNAGLISTGDMFRTDQSFLNFINTRNEQGQLTARGWSNTTTKNNDAYQNYDGSLKTAVIQDQIVESVYKDEYAKYIDDLGEYPKMNEADGQGFISFDSYRLLSISQDIWSPQQEQQYQMIINRATTDENGNVKAGEYDQTKFNTFFPSMKLQYFGPVSGSQKTALRQQGFHKFNLVPLIPGMIQGTKLETLHQKMMEQGVDYMTFESGSKVSTISKPEGIDNFYNTDRTLNEDITFEPNIIHAKFLKNQLKIHNKFKGKVTLPTQMRKILVSKLFKKDGSYISDKHKEWHQRYLKALSDMTAYKKQELKNELGITDETTLIKNSEKLVNMIRREFTDKDYTEHQIEFLFENNQLKKDLSTALNAAQVEKLLIALVDKRVTKIKVSGEGLIQMASSMTEKGQVVADMENGTNGLRAYYNKDGKVQGMQVKIALQGSFEKLLFANDLNGKKIARYKKVQKPDGKVVRELDYNTSLARLNELIKDPKWLEKHREIITISAPRIPSQAFNSLEFMEVAEFLPKNSGNIMVVASEIVAKSGSDFDVDKLFTMFPSFDIYNGVPEMIEYTDINTDVDALNIRQSNIKNDLKKIQDEISELYEEVDDNKELISIGRNLGELYQEQRGLQNVNDPVSKARLEEIDSEIAVLEAQQQEVLEVYDEEEAPRNQQLREANLDLFARIDELKAMREPLIQESADIKRKINGSTVKGLENNLLRSIVDRLKMDDVFPELIKPNATTLVKENVADKLADVATDYKKKEKIRGKESKSISPTQIFDPLYNLNKQIENAVGMDTLGVGAIGSSYYAIFQSIRMYHNMNNGLKKTDPDYIDYSIGLPHNTRTENRYDNDGNFIDQVEVVDMASELNAAGESIPDLLGQLINGWVDVAKDAWIFNIQGNKEVAPTLIYLLSAGVDFKQAVMLSSSRLVRDYIGRKQASKSAFNGLSQLDRNNPDTFDLITYSDDLAILNEVLKDNTNPKDFVPAKSIAHVYQSREEFDINKIEDYVMKPEQELTDERIAQEIEALLHFFSYEQTASQITALTMATKFDTATSANLAQIRNNKVLFDELSEKAALPLDIKRKMKQDSPIGMFDTNDLQLNLWGTTYDKKGNIKSTGFFSLKTNPLISQKANEIYQGKMFVKGRKKADNEKDFAEEFISYLYQNEYTRLENDMYRGLGIYPLENSEELYEVKDGKFYYNVAEVNALVADGNLGNTNSVIKYLVEMHLVEKDLDMDSDAVKKSASYEIAKNATQASEQSEEYAEELRDHYVEAEATIRSGNAQQLFAGPYSYKKRLDAIKTKNPTLEKMYSLVADLTPDVLDQKGTVNLENLYLPNLAESGYRDVYEENLASLREHFDPEIKQFFRMFDRFAVLQSGMKSFGKYPMTSFINPNYVERYVGPVRNDVIKAMNDYRSGSKTDVPVLDQFVQMYYKGKDPGAFKSFLKTKHRFAQFENDFYFENSVREVDSKPLTLDTFGGIIDGVEIPKIDMIMANENNMVIIKQTTKAPNESYPKMQSKVNKIRAAVMEFYPDAAMDVYSSDDSVWIVGENVNNAALGGNKQQKKVWDKVLVDLFKEYKTSIDGAIADGVRSFTVGNRSGVEKMVRDYLNEVVDDRGVFLFKSHRVLTPNGMYFKFTTNDEIVVDQIYSTKDQQISIDTELPILNMSNVKTNLTLRDKTGKERDAKTGKPYDNVYKYMVSLKSQYATAKSKKALKEKMESIKGEPTLEDFRDIMNILKTPSDAAYDELRELKIAIFRTAEQNAKFKEALLDSGKAFLNYNGVYTEFDKNFALALMQTRAINDPRYNYNGPVTETPENTDEDPFTCAG